MSTSSSSSGFFVNQSASERCPILSSSSKYDAGEPGSSSGSSLCSLISEFVATALSLVLVFCAFYATSPHQPASSPRQERSLVLARSLIDLIHSARSLAAGAAQACTGFSILLSFLISIVALGFRSWLQSALISQQVLFSMRLLCTCSFVSMPLCTHPCTCFRSLFDSHAGLTHNASL
ncbi:hypothetical protein BDR04DRAFT_412518 [Suillus decipiens]|nr:hypothetical protein BDR04DRAFT_412518 [Suillus decipiens]